MPYLAACYFFLAAFAFTVTLAVLAGFSAPAGFGALAAVFYADASGEIKEGPVDVNTVQLLLQALPAKVSTVYQIPIRENHGLRSTPYSTLPVGVIPPERFPMVFRLMPVIKGISSEIEKMVFTLKVTPILGDEGAVKIKFAFPPLLPDRPFTVLIDDAVVEKPGDERLLKEGEHNLVVVSDHYRNRSTRFIVERGKTSELVVELEDPTPLVSFEAPEGAQVFLDNTPVTDPRKPRPVEPGNHEVRFRVSDYSITRPILVQKGKTYKIALSVDIDITESD